MRAHVSAHTLIRREVAGNGGGHHHTPTHSISQRLTHTYANTHSAHMQNHPQALMPANESFFTDVMPLLFRTSSPLWEGQEPEHSSGAPL